MLTPTMATSMFTILKMSVNDTQGASSCTADSCARLDTWSRRTRNRSSANRCLASMAAGVVSSIGFEFEFEFFLHHGIFSHPHAMNSSPPFPSNAHRFFPDGRHLLNDLRTVQGEPLPLVAIPL